MKGKPPFKPARGLLASPRVFKGMVLVNGEAAAEKGKGGRRAPHEWQREQYQGDASSYSSAVVAAHG